MVHIPGLDQFFFLTPGTFSVRSLSPVGAAPLSASFCFRRSSRSFSKANFSAFSFACFFAFLPFGCGPLLD